MPRVRLIHWRQDEAAPLLAALQSAGCDVNYDPDPRGALLPALRAAPPDAVVIDLSRLPSHGREVAIAIRASKTLRRIPLVFIGGEPAKVDAVRAKLPDAAFTSVASVGPALAAAIASPPAEPVVPATAYPDRPVAAKLGIKEGTTVAAVDPPAGFPRLLGPLPPGVDFDETGAVTLWFVHDADSFRAAIPAMRTLAAATKLWVVWPKQPKIRAMNQNFIRETAIAAGLVDYKICSVSEAWSAVAIAVAGRRKAAKSST